MPQYSALAENTLPLTLATLTAASAGGHTNDLTNVNFRGLDLWVNVTAISGTSAALTVSVENKDPVANTYATAPTTLSTASITATGITKITVYPGIGASANVSANDVLRRTYRIVWGISGTTPSITATISAAFMV